MDKLVTLINSYVHLDEHVLGEVLSHFNIRKVAKGNYVIKPGQMVTDYYFIAEGGIRIYVNINDIEFTRYFAFEGEFLTDISKIKERQRTETYLQAIEETTLYTISFDDMENLYDTFPQWQKFGRLHWEYSFSDVLQTVHNFQSLSAKERYLDLLKRSDMVRRVPLKDLSSFLGITPSSLSRIRKEIE